MPPAADPSGQSHLRYGISPRVEAGRKVPGDIDEIPATARMEWQGMQETTDRAIAAPVKEVDLMRERRKPPVFRLKVE